VKQTSNFIQIKLPPEWLEMVGEMRHASKLTEFVAPNGKMTAKPR
jgi:hypothetical protein